MRSGYLLKWGSVLTVCVLMRWPVCLWIQSKWKLSGPPVLEQASEQFPTSCSNLAVFYHSGYVTISFTVLIRAYLCHLNCHARVRILLNSVHSTWFFYRWPENNCRMYYLSAHASPQWAAWSKSKRWRPSCKFSSGLVHSCYQLAHRSRLPNV